MLLVLVPVANILAPICMPIDTESLGHVVDELALVQIATGVVQLASTIVEVVLPEALVDGSIGPPHDTVALLDIGVLQDLAGVDGGLLAGLIDSLVMNVHQVATFVFLQLVENELVALVQPLASIVTSEMRLDLNNLFLITRGVRQQ